MIKLFVADNRENPMALYLCTGIRADGADGAAAAKGNHIL